MNKTVKLDKSAYSALSEIDQLVIDLNINPKTEYSVESEEVENGVTYIYLEGLTNVGLNSSCFQIIK